MVHQFGAESLSFGRIIGSEGEIRGDITDEEINELRSLAAKMYAMVDDAFVLVEPGNVGQGLIR